MRWMNLEPVIQSEVSQKEKELSYSNAYIWNLEKVALKNLLTGQQWKNRHRE